MREHIDHCHLLRDAHRLTAIGDRIAENKKPRFSGEPRQRRQREWSGLQRMLDPMQHRVA
jgi:hypothetical protein